jgi:hypothetical protein
MFNGTLTRELITLQPGVQYTTTFDFRSGGGATGTLNSFTLRLSTKNLPDGLEGVTKDTPIVGSFSNGTLNATKINRSDGEVAFRINGSVSNSLVTLSLTLNASYPNTVGFWAEYFWISTT